MGLRRLVLSVLLSLSLAASGQTPVRPVTADPGTGALVFPSGATFRSGNVSALVLPKIWVNSAALLAGVADYNGQVQLSPSGFSIGGTTGNHNTATFFNDTISFNGVITVAGNGVFTGGLNFGGSTSSNARISYVSTSAKVYSSVTVANPGVFTSTAHGFSIGDPIKLTATTANPSINGVAASASTTYYIASASFAANTFTLALTPGGTALQVTSAGSGTTTATRPATAKVRLADESADGNASVGDLAVSGNLTLTGTAATVISARNSLGFFYVPSVLTDAATITIDMTGRIMDVRTVTLGGNRTLAITNVSAGAQGTIKVVQDATGSRTLTLPSGSKVVDGGGGAIVLSVSPNAIDILTWIYDGTNFFWFYGKNFS